MAKNVAITEDGSAKVLSNVEKIKTSIQEGGTCLWVPKDDFPVGVKNVTEDGTYNPTDDNLYAYSKVVASGIGNTAMGRLITKSVTKNGTYNITDESGNPYGYSSFTVNVDTSEDSGGDSGASDPITGKDEDGNDAMVEEEDGDVTVTILPTHIKVVVLPTKIFYNRYEEIDYSGIMVYAYVSKMPHSIGTTTTEVLEGSTNPVVSIGGQNVTANIGDMILYAPERTGTNDVQLVWDGSKWVKSSDYSSEMALWKSKDYPSGLIPFEELIFPVKNANCGDEDIKERDIREYGGIRVINSDVVSFYNVVRATTDYYTNSNLAGGKHFNFGEDGMPNPYDLIDERGVQFEKVSDDCAIAIFPIFDSFTDSINYNVVPRYLGARNVLNSDYSQIYDSYVVVLANKNRDDFSAFNVTEVGTIDVNTEHYFESQHSYAYILSALEPTATLYNVSSNSFTYTWTNNGETVYYVVYLVRIQNTYTADSGMEYVPGGSESTVCKNPNLDSHISGTVNVDAPKVSIEDWRNSMGRYIWTMLYGNKIKDPDPIIPFTLPVQWKRPGDGKILETSFERYIRDEDVDAVSGADPVAPQS